MLEKYYHFESLDSPTHYHIAHQLSLRGLSMSSHPEQAAFSQKNLTFKDADAEKLEYKHRLASLLDDVRPAVMPESYLINDFNFTRVLSTLEAEKKSSWILKPSMMNNGEGIFLFKSIDNVLEHYLQTCRYGGDHVLQRYIENPHLLNGHKYSFRMFVVITNFGGTFLYPKGYFNICRKAYCDDFSERSAHLTNEHLGAGNAVNNWQIPTDRCPNFDVIFLKMKRLTRIVIGRMQKASPRMFTQSEEAPVFCIFGFDFMLDDLMKLWLLEANHFPCFPVTEKHPLGTLLYKDFWSALCEDFVLPIINKKIGAHDIISRFYHI